MVRHLKIWFTNRVGKDIARNTVDLFNPPITVGSKGHAIALHLTQIEKGYRYKQI